MGAAAGLEACDMKTRILVAAAGIPLLLVVLLVLPDWATAVLLAAMCIVAAYELLYGTALVKNKLLVIICGLMSAAVAAWSYFGLDSVFLLPGSVCFVLVLFGFMLRHHTELPFTSVCTAMFAGMVLPLLLCALTRIRVMEYGKYYVLVPFVAAFSSDSGAYFVGCAVGKRKLAPNISPKKTVEGAVGGVLCGLAAMAIYALVLHYCFDFKVNYHYAAIYGVIGSAVSILGDLSFSVLKRQTGIKDYGKLLPGHGGVLDRFDSTVLVAPVMECLLTTIPLIVM